MPAIPPHLNSQPGSRGNTPPYARGPTPTYPPSNVPPQYPRGGTPNYPPQGPAYPTHPPGPGYPPQNMPPQHMPPQNVAPPSMPAQMRQQYGGPPPQPGGYGGPPPPHSVPPHSAPPNPGLPALPDAFANIPEDQKVRKALSCIIPICSQASLAGGHHACHTDDTRTNRSITPSGTLYHDTIGTSLFTSVRVKVVTICAEADTGPTRLKLRRHLVTYSNITVYYLRFPYNSSYTSRRRILCPSELLDAYLNDDVTAQRHVGGCGVIILCSLLPLY